MYESPLKLSSYVLTFLKHLLCMVFPKKSLEPHTQLQLAYGRNIMVLAFMSYMRLGELAKVHFQIGKRKYLNIELQILCQNYSIQLYGNVLCLLLHPSLSVNTLNLKPFEPTPLTLLNRYEELCGH